MKKTYSELSPIFTTLNDSLKDSICDHMKELRHIRFNTFRDFPFITVDGEFYPATVVELEYNDGDVTAYDIVGQEWSIQHEGTIDGLMEMLYYIEEDAFELVHHPL